MGARNITLYAVVEDSGALHESDYGVLAFTTEAGMLAWEGRDHRRYVKIVGSYDELGPTTRASRGSSQSEGGGTHPKRAEVPSQESEDSLCRVCRIQGASQEGRRVMEPIRLWHVGGGRYLDGTNTMSVPITLLEYAALPRAEYDALVANASETRTPRAKRRSPTMPAETCPTCFWLAEKRDYPGWYLSERDLGLSVPNAVEARKFKTREECAAFLASKPPMNDEFHPTEHGWMPTPPTPAPEPTVTLTKREYDALVAKVADWEGDKTRALLVEANKALAARAEKAEAQRDAMNAQYESAMEVIHRNAGARRDGLCGILAWIDRAKEVEALLRESRRTHYECEDGWYSCPKAPGFIEGNGRGPDCDCGADEWNAKIDEVLG